MSSWPAPGLGNLSAGQIQTYAADSQSGALRTDRAAVSSGGVNPVSMAVTSDYANLYVANAGTQHLLQATPPSQSAHGKQA
jgi:DNA-binding beta-propeller fold protein YncE